LKERTDESNTPRLYLARRGETAWSLSGKQTELSDLALGTANWRDRFEAIARSVCDILSQRSMRMRTAILKRGELQQFSSDGTIAEYAKDIWNVEPGPLI
jgi:glucan phosphorylase